MFERSTIIVLLAVNLVACSTNSTTQQIPDVMSGSDMTLHSKTYSNNAFAFSLELPTTWYLPTSDDLDPHFYETKICANEYNVQCAAFEIQNHDAEFTEGPDGIFEAANSEGLKPKKRLDIIPDAIVIETLPEGGAEGWFFEYHVFFPKEKRRLLIFSNDKQLETTIFSTIKIGK